MATRSKLAVMLHADVVGSTELVQRDERIAHARIQSAFRLLSETIKDYQGTTHEVRGDALVAEFARASDAVSAALRFQASNAIENAHIEDGIQPDIRIGISLGEVIIADSTVTGAGVVLAQRLEQLAHPRGVCISAAVREALPARLPFDFDDLGERELKGFDEPVRAFIVGLQRGSEIPEPEAPHTRTLLSSRRFALAAITVLALALAAVGWQLFQELRPTEIEEPPSFDAPQLSIAVLPFENLSGDPDQNYFADVLTEDLTSDLSRITGSFVISRRSAAMYRGQNLDARRVARELNVRYLLEGTVRRTGSDVRVNVQLTDGKTAQQLWSERYARTVGDMQSFQETVTGRVARTLNLELKDALSREVARRDPRSLDANDFAQRAWAELWTKPQSRETNETALEHVSRALALDSENAEALGVAAYAYARAATYRWGFTREDALGQGIAAGEKSVALDPENADALYSLGYLYYVAGEAEKSQELMRQCIDVNRSHAPAYFFYGLNLIRLGHPKEAIGWVERAFTLSPRDPLRSVWYGVIARAHLLVGNDSMAVEIAQKGVAANKKHSNNHAVLASAYAHLGKLDDAEAALEQFVRLQPGITVGRYQQRLTGGDPVAVRTYERLMAGLRKAGVPD